MENLNLRNNLYLIHTQLYYIRRNHSAKVDASFLLQYTVFSKKYSNKERLKASRKGCRTLQSGDIKDYGYI
jgi:hypothetical protein